MSDEIKSQAGPFDVETVRQLTRLMRKFDLSELSLQDGDRRVRLRRGSVAPTLSFTPAQGAPAITAPAAALAMPTQPAAPQPPAAAPGRLEIKSPMVGTFYSKPAPDKDDYVKIGGKVSPETVVCKVEAMKIFNDLTAGLSGVIAEILVQNGGFVEYDQVLFRVDPS